MRRGLPLSVIVTDYFHWSAMGDYRFDAAEWPDPEAMVAELADLGVELMVSIWPTVSPLSENFADYRDRGLLVGSRGGARHRPSSSSTRRRRSGARARGSIHRR